jgi:hypothetical protein
VSAGRVSAAGRDPDALLVALVLDPSTYSRNRFFDLYSDPAVRRVRRRAALVRSILRHLAATAPRGARLEDVLDVASPEPGWVELSYTVPRLGLRRTTRLESLELSLVRFAVARGAGRCLPAEDADRIRVEGALRTLADPVGATGPATGRPTPTPPAAGTGT